MHEKSPYDAAAQPARVSLNAGVRPAVALAGATAVPGSAHVAGRIRGRHGVQHDSTARRWADVIGGIAFMIVVTIIVQTLFMPVIQGYGWSAGIGREAVWIITALICVPLCPPGVLHSVTWKSTWKGIALDWPEVLLATYILTQSIQLGLPNGILGPVAFSLSVGIAEEFLFRVLLLGWLVTRLPAPQALLVSAIVFGIVHVPADGFNMIGLMNVTSQFAGGLILGAVYLRTRNPLAPILLHAYWDAAIFLGISPDSSMAARAEAAMPEVGAVMFTAALAIYGFWLVRPGSGAEHAHLPAPALHHPLR